ncbi:energy-coupling factor ABC transporter ATP-binding protein [Nevskia soli]|uniref:energy-coupling factor ABC transporter ATP-binding protein n=1 Tax=Nevskia soli TaxID=418856 RepID=UPI0015D736CA|nr:ABC transporter ATP-binding protein [Nevskia soli]
MSPVLTVEDLRFAYSDGTSALNGVDFTLYEGETVAILGANGSGKTTFVLHLNGILQGTGAIRLDGVSLSKDTASEFRAKVGIVFQDSDNQLFMPTVLEDVAFGLLNQGIPPEKAEILARAALEVVGIQALADKPPFHLSAGEKKRAAIAGILAMQPRVLIFDEPTTFLDPPGRRGLIRLLADLTQPKLLVTHDVEFAAKSASRAIFFEKGRIAAQGDVKTVASRFGWLD